MPRRRQRQVQARPYDDLYAQPLESFTDARNQLARSLRAAGDTDAAERVAALRKPTVAAWAVNQLSRHHRREVDLLLDAGHRLIEAQQGARTAEELAAAARQHRDAVESLVRLARALLGTRASEETVRKIAETLRAASLTEAGREELARGLLTDAVTTTGWDILVARTGPTTSRTRTPKPKAPDRKAETDRAKSRLKDAESEHKTAVRVARDAADALEEAQRLLDAAELRANAASDALAAAAERVSEARAELDRLRRAPG
jgi:hypothetical protein